MSISEKTDAPIVYCIPLIYLEIYSQLNLKKSDARPAIKQYIAKCSKIH